MEGGIQDTKEDNLELERFIPKGHIDSKLKETLGRYDYWNSSSSQPVYGSCSHCGGSCHGDGGCGGDGE